MQLQSNPTYEHQIFARYSAEIIDSVLFANKRSADGKPKNK